MIRGRLPRWCAAVWGLTALPLTGGARAAPSSSISGADAASASASATGASAKVKPRGERQVRAVARPIVKKKGEAAAKAKREGRVSMQIPERMRAMLERQIDDRIERDAAALKRLRPGATGP